MFICDNFHFTDRWPWLIATLLLFYVTQATATVGPEKPSPHDDALHPELVRQWIERPFRDQYLKETSQNEEQEQEMYEGAIKRLEYAHRVLIEKTHEETGQFEEARKRMKGRDKGFAKHFDGSIGYKFSQSARLLQKEVDRRRAILSEKHRKRMDQLSGVGLDDQNWEAKQPEVREEDFDMFEDCSMYDKQPHLKGPCMRRKVPTNVKVGHSIWADDEEL